MSEPRPRISVIIPNWNGRHHLRECLSALQRQTFSDHEVILVDNGSTDDSQVFTREAFPDVKVIELGENQGFTGACNVGYAASRGEFVCLLNNDTEADDRWLEVIVDTFCRYPRVGVVASKMLLYDRRDHFHSAGDYYRVNGIPGNRGVWKEDTGQYDREEPVFSACGGAAAYRRTLIEAIGFLDNAFFFSCEDIDLSWRAHLAGWEVIYAPEAVVYHKLKASGGSGAIGSYHDGRNFLYVIWKNYPTQLLRRHAGAVLKAQAHITLEALRAWRGPAARARIRGQLAGFLGFFKMRAARKQIQASRRIELQAIEARMTAVDENF